MKRNRLILLVVIALMLTSMACAGSSDLGLGPSVTISIMYGSEKEDWLEAVTADFNAASYTTESGARIVVETTPEGSIESMNAILEGRAEPTVWSPASSLYIPLANEQWRATHSEDLVAGTPEELVLSPVVIAMWRPMAEALGWPDQPIGWADVAELSFDEEGWAGYGYPEWGEFKFGHTHPDYSNSGFISVIAEAYAGAGKVRGLTPEDMQDPEVIQFMTDVENSIIHYGRSTGFFARQMFGRGPSYLSAAVLYENLVVAQEAARLSGESAQIPVVAIYPEEGTFWSDHPYITLNAPWVTDEQAEAAAIFEEYLLAPEQQQRALEFGFRPSDPSIPLSAPIDANHGVDPQQPQTILEVPDVETIYAAQDLWREAKKPVDLVVVMDVSGSMEGDKIAAARSSLIQFVDLLADRDRLQIILFDDEIITMTELTELGPKRSDVQTRVSGIIEDGYTSLYDAVLYAYDDLAANGDPDHIRAIVVLSDGADTASVIRLPDVIADIESTSEGQGGDAIKVFTIAFGGDADLNVLESISEATGARMYEGDISTIQDVYIEISTFF